MSRSKAIFVLAGALVLASASSAKIVDSGLAGKAANDFIANNPIGSEILQSRSVASLEQWRNIWIANLEPEGFLAISGSTKQEPIVIFSASGDFAAPDESSALFAILDGSSEGAATLEENEEADENSKWRAISNTRKIAAKTRALANNIDAKIVVIDKFLPFHWSQNYPYNSLTPLNRYSGCVATAGAQELAYWQWPYRAEDIRTSSHELSEGGRVTLRFDGHEPFDYSKMPYSPSAGTTKEEAFQIARLIMWCQSLVHMIYSANGSGATLRLNGITPFYTKGETLEPTADNLDSIVSKVKEDMLFGSPVQISIPQHAVVGHGLAQSEDDAFIYLNYGWAGGSDGWYNLKDRTSSSSINRIDVGFRPQKTVQVDALGAKSSAFVTLAWHAPKCYETSISGFEIYPRKETPADSPQDFIDTFDSALGEISNSAAIQIIPKAKEGEKSYLRLNSNSDGTYTYPDAFLIGEDTVLACELSSSAMQNMKLGAEIRLEDGAWQTILAPPLSTGASNGPAYLEIPLGEYAGRRAEVRLAVSRTSVNCYGGGEALVYSLSLSGVRRFSVAEEFAPIKIEKSEARSYQFTAPEEGYYSFTVKPIIANEETIASRRVATLVDTAASAPPKIESVSAKIDNVESLEDGFFLRLGKMAHTIKMDGENISRLEAFSSHPDALAQDAISTSAERGTVSIDAEHVASACAKNRIVLTIKATNSDGTSSYKDIELYFDDYQFIPDAISTIPFKEENVNLDSNGSWAEIEDKPLLVIPLENEMKKFTIVFDAFIPESSGSIFAFAPGPYSIKIRRMENGTIRGFYNIPGEEDDSSIAVKEEILREDALAPGEHEIKIEYTNANDAHESVRGTRATIDGELFYQGKKLQYANEAITNFTFGAAAPTAKNMDILAGLKIKNLRIIDDIFADTKTGEAKSVKVNGAMASQSTSFELIDMFELVSLDTNIVFEIASFDGTALKLIPNIDPPLKNGSLHLMGKQDLKDDWINAKTIAPKETGEEIDLNESSLEGYRFFRLRAEP